jgi:GNAT superfamily N-acetyltransferase
VGAATLCLSAYAAGIHDVGVVEEERGKGIGSALIAHVLRVARERGQKHAVLISSGMGETMYQRVGFREVCRIGFWYRAR